MNLDEAYLGIELGSTRIKSVLIDKDHSVLAVGTHTWENSRENGIWTYPEHQIISGLQSSYASIKESVKKKYGVTIKSLGGIGISAMMHGYIVLDSDGRLAVPFRTWRNTITAEAAEDLSELFGFNIPERWSIAHLYQAILNGEPHVKSISYLTTLSGLIHYKLTGEKVIGIGDGSGMFPVGSNGSYDDKMKNLFDSLIKVKGIDYSLDDILPRIVKCGERAGTLTESGARLLDTEGDLACGIPLCPPEGDAETGMVATNSVRVNTGNVSAGTSVFAMAVLDKPPSKRYSEIDVVATPDGNPVAMVHCNNCTNEINAYANMFKELAEAFGIDVPIGKIYDFMFERAMKGESSCGGLTAYNYLSGEPITRLSEGRPMLVRSSSGNMTLDNLMRAELFSAVATLNIGMRILSAENVSLSSMVGHGGYFKSTKAGALAMSLALGTPVTVMETAGEGGAWGMAVLAAYMMNRDNMSLPDYLDRKVFMNMKTQTVSPNEEEIKGFNEYMDRYERGLAIERKAVEVL